MTTSVILSGLTTTIFAGEGMDEVLKQVGAATGDCWIEGGKIVKVVAPDGIVFAGPSGTLIRPDGFDVTDLCILADLETQIRGDRTEREEMLMHTAVRVQQHQWHREFRVAA